MEMLTLLLVGALAGPPAPTTEEPRATPTTEEHSARKWATLGCLATAADLATTEWSLSRGGYEIVGPNRARRDRLIVGGVSCFMNQLLVKMKPKWAKWVGIGQTGVRGSIAVWNVKEAIK